MTTATKQPVVCGKTFNDGPVQCRCTYAKGHKKPCWRYLSVTQREGYVPGTRPTTENKKE